MLDFNAPEFLVVGIVALLVIGPKDLPKALRLLGKWIGRARGVARQFRTGMDTMIRESELADLEKQWATENERIMRDHPVPALNAPVMVEGDPAEPVMVEQPAIRPALDAPETAIGETPARKPRKRKAPATGDTLEAPKPASPRAKARSGG